jgi:AcrR family transcriptional regulator
LPTSRTRTRPSWAGIPAEDRRAERRTQLLDAAFDLLGTEGWAGTTVRGVCQAARLNPRYFYESFEDLDALVVAVYDRLVEQLWHQGLAAIEAAGDDPAEQLRAAIGSIVRFVDEDRRRGRVLYVEALGNEALNRRRIRSAQALAAFVDQDSARRHGAAPEGEHIGRIGAAILVGGMTELLVEWLEGRIDVTPEQLVDDATALFLGIGDAAAQVIANRGERSSVAASRGRIARPRRSPAARSSRP